MKKIFAGALFSLVLALGLLGHAEARTVSVKGYYKPSIGRYIAPSHRTSPNSSLFDNWSTKGNYNPYTGKKGYVNPYKW